MKAHLRQTRDAQVAACYLIQPSLRSIARLFDLSHEGVRKILKAQGVEIAEPCTWNNPVGVRPLLHQLQPGVPRPPLGTPGTSSTPVCNPPSAPSSRPGRSPSLPTGATL